MMGDPSFTFTASLFIVPTLYAYALKVKDVAWASLLCLITSVMNHATFSQIPAVNLLDTVVVRSIALAYVLHALYSVVVLKKILYASVVAMGILTWVLYVCGAYHCWVHVLAIAGIMLYIHARRASNTSKEEN